VALFFIFLQNHLPPATHHLQTPCLWAYAGVADGWQCGSKWAKTSKNQKKHAIIFLLRRHRFLSKTPSFSFKENTVFRLRKFRFPA